MYGSILKRKEHLSEVTNSNIKATLLFYDLSPRYLGPGVFPLSGAILVIDKVNSPIWLHPLLPAIWQRPLKIKSWALYINPMKALHLYSALRRFYKCSFFLRNILNLGALCELYYMPMLLHYNNNDRTATMIMIMNQDYDHDHDHGQTITIRTKWLWPFKDS